MELFSDPSLKNVGPSVFLHLCPGVELAGVERPGSGCWPGELRRTSKIPGTGLGVAARR